MARRAECARGNGGSDPIGATEFCARLVALCLRSPRLGLPRKERDRHIVLASVILTLDPTRGYDEPAINEALKRWRAEVGRLIEIDHVALRRALVDERFVERDGYGHVYRVSGRARSLLAPELEQLDVCALIEEERHRIEERRSPANDEPPG